MKILWLTENFPPSKGGMSHSCDRLVHHFRKQGTVIDLCHFTNRRPPFVTETQVNGTYTAVPKSQDMGHGLHQALNFIEHHLPIQSYDLIMAFGGLIPTTAAPVFSRLLQLPLYLCIRGNDFDLAIFNFKRRPVLSEAIQQSAGVFAVSKDKVRRIQCLYPTAHVHYSPNGIDMEEWKALKSEINFARSWRGQPERKGKKVLGLFGYLKEKKGILFFLKALLKSHVRDRVHLLFSGEQEEGVASFMEGHGISHHTLPFLNRTELIKYYMACDWVVIPSFYDGMPNVMLEAGALGIPIMASATDGMKDVIQHEGTGLLFRPMDERDCAHTLRQAVTMETQKQHDMGTALAAYLQHNHTADIETENYLNILKKEIHENNHPSIDTCPQPADRKL